MQVITAAYLICLIIVIIGVVILVYGDKKNEPFCLITGPLIMVVGVGLLAFCLML